MFPIRDIQGGAIAFGGRVLNPEHEPKYLNSPDSPVFHKGETLFGLDRAREEIRNRREAMVVEGYLDAIVCHQYGFENAVAPLGTALTSGHLRRIGRTAESVLLVFDGDEAGRRAARRSLEAVATEGLSCRVLMLPAGDDPDGLLRREGAEALTGLIEQARSIVDFMLEASGMDRREAVRETLKVIARVSDPLMRDEHLRELAERSGFRESTLREELGRLGRTAEGRAMEHREGPAEGGQARGPLRLMYNEETILLSVVLGEPERLAWVLERLELEALEDARIRSIFERLASANTGGGQGSAVLEEVKDSMNGEELGIVRQLEIKPGFDKEDIEKNLRDCLVRLGLRPIERKLGEAKQRGDQSEIARLAAKRQQLLKGGAA